MCVCVYKSLAREGGGRMVQGSEEETMDEKGMAEGEEGEEGETACVCS